ncbi:MAG: 2-oxo acid dehydrogenase subunit E2 [Oscillospiraceae bacterium]|nr:2-oxo acid dehydrogenase subunit E2 [Oscillospiraceae bacterium]
MAYKKRLGDRKEGRRLRTLEPYNAMTPFIMKVKSDASNFFSDSIEITEAEKFLRAKRMDGQPGLGLLHLFVATFVRTASQYPGLNRFVSGQRIFARNSIDFVTTVKKEMRLNAPETSIKIAFDPRDTINDVYDKLNVEVAKVKDAAMTNTDDVAKSLVKLPRLLLKFVIFCLTALDYFGRLPKSLIQASPFHGSFTISDVGSIGIPVIYHHLYNFGNMPLFISFGAKRKVYETQADGTVILRKYIDFTLVMDERICDGFYFSQAFKLFRSILRNPHVLETPPETVVEDVE